MRTTLYSIILMSLLCFAASRPHAASVYLWTDENGRMHITDGPPSAGGSVRDVIEYEPRSEPQPVEPLPRSETVEPDSKDKKDKEDQCRHVFAARRNLRKTRSMAAAVRQRAQEARERVKDLRERIGFDDDRRDDFKDDLKRLEEKARLADMFAQQAKLDIQVAELQVKLAETEVDVECSERY